MPTTITTLIIDINAKKYSLQGSKIAFRESVEVRLTNYGSASAENLVLHLYHRKKKVAECTLFTNSGLGYYVGTLNLDTPQLVQILGKYSHIIEKPFEIVLWDKNTKNALITFTINVKSNPYQIVSEEIIPNRIVFSIPDNTTTKQRLFGINQYIAATVYLFVNGFNAGRFYTFKITNLQNLPTLDLGQPYVSAYNDLSGNIDFSISIENDYVVLSITTTNINESLVGRLQIVGIQK